MRGKPFGKRPFSAITPNTSRTQLTATMAGHNPRSQLAVPDFADHRSRRPRGISHGVAPRGLAPAATVAGPLVLRLTELSPRSPIQR